MLSRVMIKFKTKQFKTLQREWYRKLKDSGFDDIEDVDSPEEYLKAWHSQYFQKRHTPDKFIANQEYYRRTQAFLMHYTFANQLDKQIWKMHSEGRPLRAIAKKLTITVHKTNTTIKYLESQMPWVLTLLW